MFDFDLLSERARVSPGRIALISVATGERLTYAQLDARAAASAATFPSLGVAAGERLGILAHNCTEFVETFFGAMKAGVIAVPLSTRATAHELNAIIADCEMSRVLIGEGFEAVSAQLTCPQSPLPRSAGTAPPPTSPPSFVGDDESIACLLYTSGTTGKPKGVMIPRRQLLWNGYNTALNWSLRKDDVSPIFTPLYHAGGLAAFMIPIFCAGGTIVLHRSFVPAEVWKTIDLEGCTVVLGVPTIWKMLLDAPELNDVSLTRVRWFISGGAPLPQYLIDAYQKRGVAFKQGYGMTEVGVNCFTMTVEESYRKPGSIGRAMLFTAVRLVDEAGQLVGDDEVGEMQIRGPHVSLGYWKNEEATRVAYDADRWLHTGDLARRDSEGFFYIAGRRKEMFISGGVNIYPAEIEAVLVSHPSVADAAVIPLADPTWGEVGVAFIVATTGEAELRAYLAERLARYKLPSRYLFVDALPRTPYGKVEKHVLAARINQDNV
jgi:fatty-acyl-CoA synthase